MAVDIAALDIRVKSTGINKATRDLGSLEKGSRKVETATQRMERSFSSLKRVAVAAFAAIAAQSIIAFQAIKVGASFEQEMAKVRGITNATASEFKALTKIAKELGATTEWSATQAAQGLEFLGMAGFSAAKSIKALPGVLDLATAGAIDLGRAADIVSNALTAMRLPVESLSRVNDVFVKTITSSNTNMEMMAESFKYSAPLAAAYGMEIETLAGLIGMLGNAGIQGSMAGTQLAFAFQNVQKVFDKYGESATRADGSSRDLIDALKLLQERGASTSEVMEIFGVRAGRAALALLGQGVPALEAYIREIENAEGATSKLADIMRDTLTGDIKTLKSTLEDVSISMFKTWGTDLRTLVQATTQIIRENKDALVEFFKGMASGALTAFKAIIKGIAKLREAFLGLISLVGMVQKSFAEIAIKGLEIEIAGLEQRIAILQKDPSWRERTFGGAVGGEAREEALKNAMHERTVLLQQVVDKRQEISELTITQLEIEADLNRQLIDIDKIIGDVQEKLKMSEAAKELEKTTGILGEMGSEAKKTGDKIKELASDDLMDLIDAFGFAGQSFGNEMADGINNAIISMQSLNDMFIEHTKLQTKLNAEKEAGKDTTAAQQILDEKYIQSQITGYRQLFGAVSQLFKEGSEEREIFHKAEMAFAVAELAMGAKKMAMDAAGTVVAIANSAKRCVAWGVEAVAAAVAGIAGQATGDPYTAFARIAAMIALMGSVLAMAGKSFGGGGSSGGYSGGGRTATTGTVLGAPTESSESLQHSLDLMEEYHAEDYHELIGIHNELIDLNKNITGLVSGIVRGFGTFEGGKFEESHLIGWAKAHESFVDLNEKIIAMHDKFFGKLAFILGDRLTIACTRLLGKIGGWIGKKLFGGEVKISVTGAGIALGGGTVGEVLAGETPSVQAYYDIYKKTKGGLFGGGTKRKRWTEYEAVEPDIERLFDKIYENISNMLVYLGEGFNVSAEDMAAIFSYQFEAMKIDLKGLTGAEITEKISAWISTLGDTAVEALFSEVVGKYQEIDEGMLETAMRLIAQKEILFSALEMTNMAFDDTSTSAIDFSQALIAVGGEFEDLIEAISNYYDKFFTDAEKHQDLMGGLTDQLIQQNLVLPDTREGYRALVEGLDLTTESGMKAYVTLMNAADAADTYYDYIEDIFEDIEDSIQSVFDDIATEGMDQYTAALYEINQKYKAYAEDLESIGRLYDEQGNLTAIATRALSAYNLEIQRLANTILNTIRDTQRQLATMGMPSGQASILGIASRYGIAPSAIQSQGRDFLSWYAQADPAEIAIALATWGVSIDQFNADMIALGNYFMNQSETHHREAQATRNEMISSWNSAIDSIQSMLADLSPTGKFAPVQSKEAFQNEYDRLMELIRTSDDPGKYAAQLQAFLPDYLDFMGAFGGDYAALVEKIRQELEDLDVELKSERDYLREISGSSGSTAANTQALLDLGVPITFNTTGLDDAAVAFLQGLQEIVRLVGWNSPFTIDFVANYTGFATMPWDDFVNVLFQVAEKVPGGWYAPITMDIIMSFENWDDTTLEEKIAAWGAIRDVYGWHSPVTFEFMADMVDTGTVSWDDWLTLIGGDPEIEKELIIYLNNNTGMSSDDLSAIFGKDTVANMHIDADLIWKGEGYIDVLVGSAVTIAKFGNVNADSWTTGLATGILWMLDELKRIRKNTAALNQGLGVPSYASGGLTSGRSFAGEAGPEWVVPTYEPQRSSFLSDVGANPEAIGKAVAKYLVPVMGSDSGEKEVHIHLSIDGQDIRDPVIIGLQGRDTELIEATRRVSR